MSKVEVWWRWGLREAEEEKKKSLWRRLSAVFFFCRFREKKKIQKVRNFVGLCPLLSGPRKN